MKITKIKIKNLYGIKEYEADGKDVEISGKNGVGKTAVLDAIKYALTNRSDRRYLIRQGESEGEIIIQTDTGLSIHRKARTDKADYKSIKQAGDKSEKTEGFLREIFTELQLNPIEFAQMTEQEQNRIILDLIDFKWDLNWIKAEFGEIVPEVNYQQNILCVLHEIQSEEGFYFRTRQDINREARNKTAFIEEIGLTLPKNYNAQTWENVGLGDLYKEIETRRVRNNEIEKAKAILRGRESKIRQAQADLEIAKGTIDRETSAERNRLDRAIVEWENRIKNDKKDLADLEEKRVRKIELVQKSYAVSVADVEAEVKQYEEVADLEPSPLDDLQSEADHAEHMKGFVNEFKRMIELKKDVERLNAESNVLTTKIEHARELPGQILEKSNIPVEGLSIKDGIPLINGLPISNLSEGEKFELCISVTTRNTEALQMVLIDGIERLATGKRTKVYADLKKKGIQFIATRTSDDDVLNVVQL